MSKLLEDEKVAALVAKEIAKATKAANKRAVELIKAAADANKEVEDKTTKKAVAEVLKGLAAGVKATADAE